MGANSREFLNERELQATKEIELSKVCEKYYDLMDRGRVSDFWKRVIQEKTKPTGERIPLVDYSEKSWMAVDKNRLGY